jgi:putative ABC transport system permease protein
VTRRTPRPAGAGRADLTRPPRLAEWILRRALPGGDSGDSVLGDLIEEWHARGGTYAAAISFWRQTLSIAVRYRSRRTRPDALALPDGRTTRIGLDNIRQDVRYAVRSYAKAPSFALTILVTLALGIGASTAIFSMVNGILLRPLPLPEPERLVFVNEVGPTGTGVSVSWPNYLDWRARARSFDGLASSRTDLLTLTGVETPQRLEARRVSGNFLRVLGVTPTLGRGFEDADDRAGAEPVVVLSDEFWRARFGGDGSVVGRLLTLDGRPHRVAGVLPPGFRYIRPYALFVSMSPHADAIYTRERSDHAGHFVVGRLKAGVAIDAAAAELRGIAADLQRDYPGSNTGISVAMQPLASRVVADVRLTLVVLMGAVGCLLLISCVNVANLLVARGAARQHELAVRAALGGSRLRLVSQLLVESTIVSAAGGAAGLAAAWWLVRVLVAVAPPGTPRLDEVRLDGVAVVFALAATTICGVAFGAFPAFLASRMTGQETVVRGPRGGASAPSHRLRRGLMVVEVAVALVLLAGAGLMARTLRELMRVDTGFRGDHVLTLRASLVGPQWPQARRRLFFEHVRSGVAAIPGVRAAAVVSRLPTDGSDWSTPFISADMPVPERRDLPFAAITMPGPGYFDAIGTRVVRGRAFTSADTEDSAAVAMVNESLARRIWPGGDAIGKRVKWGWPESPGAWREVVGIAADVKYEGVAEPTPLQVYIPITQETPRDIAVVVNTTGPPSTAQGEAERVIHAFDPDVPVYSVRTTDEMLAASMARERMAMMILTVFAAVALTLASIGLYGVVAHGVTERTHEIGVRMALGAEASHVVGLVLWQGLSMAVIGAAIGVGVALAMARWIQALLFGVTATDPATFGAVVAALLAVAAVACYIPAWRATRVDPSSALRAE